MAMGPLGQHCGREDKAHHGREEGEHDVRAHAPTFSRALPEVKRDAQV
jgi:hypothetical protein